jgi:hypothetical protein
MAKFCNKWNLHGNFDKTKVTVFKNGRKLKNRECSYLSGQKLEVANEITYLGVKFEQA